MARLDAEQQEASRHREVEGVPADVAVCYLRELSTTWAKADGDRAPGCSPRPCSSGLTCSARGRRRSGPPTPPWHTASPQRSHIGSMSLLGMVGARGLTTSISFSSADPRRAHSGAVADVNQPWWRDSVVERSA